MSNVMTNIISDEYWSLSLCEALQEVIIFNDCNSPMRCCHLSFENEGKSFVELTRKQSYAEGTVFGFKSSLFGSKALFLVIN